MGAMEVFLQSFSPVSVLGSVVLILIGFHFFLSIFRSQWQKNEPPGPTPLPFLGNMLQIDLKKPYKTLMEFYRKYGPVFTIYLGPKKVVVLAGYKAVKEALVTHDDVFGDRDPLLIFQELSKGHGVIWNNGDAWKEMRRFSLTNLRDFGMGKKVCEDKIIEESQHLIEVFKKHKGKAFDTSQSLGYAVSNIICSMVYGSRFEYDDPEFTSMVNRTTKGAIMFGSPSIQAYNTFPTLFKRSANRRILLEMNAASQKQNLALFSNLKETLNPQMCRGLADAFLVQKQKLEEAGVVNSQFHDDNLYTTVLNLFAAGTETTSTTLRWCLLFMAKFPQIQDKVQEELRQVIGDRQVQVADRKNLPYTDAVLHETQRMASIIPMSLPHKTTRDITFQGHFIKKGTTVYPLLMSVLCDETEWEKPHTFYPPHFLDKDGKFRKRDAFIPFSAGRRICLGESLARMELFIFFSTLLQHFHFSPPPGVSEDELELTPHTGLTLTPLPHELCAASRM
ncbi:cytochrome P450 2K1-like isoform X2 [Xiphophorus maculatus]|uniref:cytochrome P450 2K1-like isoform X2 n=1 Tax=Xiphophorus maculatus TaxID=8083 RepID=UPI000C6E62A2|nr:cytochrome P450 2K1-like isoform X2 [Xiphophorus maculatus]